jgi:hypothetical protein
MNELNLTVVEALEEASRVLMQQQTLVHSMVVLEVPSEAASLAQMVSFQIKSQRCNV